MPLVRPLALENRRPPHWRLARWLGALLAMFVLVSAASAQETPPADGEAAVGTEAEEAVEIAVPLLERSPFDRITLNAENDNAVIETVLLELPERSVPNPLPTTGALELRRLSHPSIPYSVNWSAITKVELFEQMLLAEAERLTVAGDFTTAFNYYAYLRTNYAQLPGLESALQDHLWREASSNYAAGKRDEAWPALLALYLRNPQFPRLVNAVQAVSDDLIGERLEAKNYDAARTIVDMLEQSFPKLQLANLARWRGRFEIDAAQQMEVARAALAAKEYGEARAAVNYARSIMPTVAGGAELWREIQETAPEIRVGVTQGAAAGTLSQTPTWAAARVGDLVNPRLVEMVDFGAEGGVYACPWGEIRTSNDGLTTTIELSAEAVRRGLRPETLALKLVEMAGGDHSLRQDDFAALIAGVDLANGRDVNVAWRRPHVRPEAFLQMPLRWLTTAVRGPGLWFDPQPQSPKSPEQGYQRTGPPVASDGEPRLVVERVFDDDEAAVEALAAGDIDAVDRVPPWQLDRLRGTPGVTVGEYRLPTVHVLIPNPANPLLEQREFRRAINYGIDGESIVRDILLAGAPRAGFRTLSGPFPAGVSLNDPAGYAYNGELTPRPYEPRLAALLAGVARTTLAKREAELKKVREAEAAKQQAAEGNEAPKDAAAPPAEATPVSTAEKPAEPEEAKKTPPDPLILAHSSDPLARLASQSIKIQLDGIGIPIKLVEFAGGSPAADLKYDLLYAELAVWEPIFDARRLLGADGVAGRASALMTTALDKLDRAENWNQARAQLKEIHRIAHYDLPLIPLWQTVNHFAHRKSVAGVGTNPVSLYQNISAWRKSYE